MKTLISKKIYNEPHIELIMLDNEISLQLDSSPPAGLGEPGYVVKIKHDCIANDPFKNNLG